MIIRVIYENCLRVGVHKHSYGALPMERRVNGDEPRDVEVTKRHMYRFT